jgi:hypothetical protein
VSSITGNTTLIGDRNGAVWAKITPTAFEYGAGSIMSYAIPTSSWRFITVTKSGQNFTYYSNAIVVATNTSAATVTNLPFYFGGDPFFPSDGYMTGMIDDVRVYNRALSAAEVGALYAGGK